MNKISNFVNSLYEASSIISDYLSAKDESSPGGASVTPNEALEIATRIITTVHKGEPPKISLIEVKRILELAGWIVTTE